MTKSRSDIAKEFLAGVFGFALMFAVFRGLLPPMATRAIFGGIGGAAVGLVPYSIQQRRTGATRLWPIGVCAASGMLLGLLLAVPVGILLSVYLWATTPPPR